VGWLVAARSTDLEDGSVLGAEINGIGVVALYRIRGSVYAKSDACTHEVAQLSDGYLDGDCIECRPHRALFHVPTGKVRSPPANEPISTYPAKEETNRVLVDLPQ
jgi:nitrite reductase/ring-hydroxylating ferredoxin subunit